MQQVTIQGISGCFHETAVHRIFGEEKIRILHILCALPGQRLAALSEVQWATARRNPATIRARMEQTRRL